MKLSESFYLRGNVPIIAKQLLGKVLITKINNQVTSGMIVETEAYSYKERGCHAFRGITQRNEVMFERGGRAYVYLCYGVHEMFNVVTNDVDKAEAILIRALEPISGIDIMQDRMGVDSSVRITSGPGKLTKALGINRKLNGEELKKNLIWIEDKGIILKQKAIACSARIGIDYAGEDALLPWRFTIKENKWVSRK